MEGTFKSAESAGCPYPEFNPHSHQLHLSISSLPCPTEPLSITSFPIELVAESKNYDAKKIANFWLQLLSIKIQTGNFWAWEEALKAHNESRSLVEMVKKKQVRERTCRIHAIGLLYLSLTAINSFIHQT
jgi:hypothetical protein